MEWLDGCCLYKPVFLCNLLIVFNVFNLKEEGFLWRRKEISMNNDLMTGISATIRYRVLGVRNRSLLKHLAFATCVTLIAAIFMAQPIPA